MTFIVHADSTGENQSWYFENSQTNWVWFLAVCLLHTYTDKYSTYTIVHIPELHHGVLLYIYTVLCFEALYYMHCTALYCTVLHCTVLHCTALYCTVLHCIALYCTALQCSVLYCTTLHYTVYCTLLV